MMFRLEILTTLFSVISAVMCSDTCPAPVRSAVQISITGRRNNSGHWLFGVELARSSKRVSRPALLPEEMSLDVNHEVEYCEATETVKLNTQMSVSGRTPPKGYEMVNNLGFYKLHTTALTWNDARDKCDSEGAHLIMINSGREADIAREYFFRKPTILNATNAEYAHVGFHNRYQKDQYITLEGQPVAKSGYFKWAANQPKGGNNNCAVIDRSGSYHDSLCDTWKFFFICEYN